MTGSEPVRHQLVTVAAPGFDEAFYRAQLGYNSEAVDDALEHYLRYGWRDGLDPSAGFSTRRYLRSNPDVRIGGGNPLAHFINLGFAEGRLAHPEQTPQTFALNVRLSGFDEAFYRSRLPFRGEDIANALDHFLEVGWRDGYDPSAGFRTSGYLRAYPDVEAADINPLVHYLECGLAEGRLAHRSEYTAEM